MALKFDTPILPQFICGILYLGNSISVQLRSRGFLYKGVIETKTKTVDYEELCRIVAAQCGVAHGNVRQVIDVTLSVVSEALKQRYKVLLPRFGSFEPKLRKQRIGRNPRTGEAVPIEERVRPVFNPSDILCEKIK